MDEKREEDVRCIRDFHVMSELLRKGFRIVDINKDKKFVCPVLNEKCTFKSVVYFLVEEGFDEAIQDIYIEMEKKLKEDYYG